MLLPKVFGPSVHITEHYVPLCRHRCWRPGRNIERRRGRIGRQALYFSPLPSTPSLLLHFVGRGHSTSGALVLARFGCGGGGGRLDKGTHLPQDRLLAEVQGSLDPPIPPECLHPIID